MYDVNTMQRKCEDSFIKKDWKQLCLDISELITAKVNRICAENQMTVQKNSKDAFDWVISKKLIKNSKIHQIRMMRNDIVHNAYEIDKLDAAIIKATYLYIKPFIRKDKFPKKVFE